MVNLFSKRVSLMSVSVFCLETCDLRTAGFIIYLSSLSLTLMVRAHISWVVEFCLRYNPKSKVWKLVVILISIGIFERWNLIRISTSWGVWLWKIILSYWFCFSIRQMLQYDALYDISRSIYKRCLSGVLWRNYRKVTEHEHFQHLPDIYRNSLILVHHPVHPGHKL